MSVNLTNNQPFVRTRFTWFGYGMMAFFALGFSIPGPIMPFIAEKLSITYTQMGYHFTMVAAGGLLVGLFGARVAGWIGNRTVCWLGVILESIGALGLVWSSILTFTMISAFIYGMGVSTVAFIIGASLADAHPRHTTKAFTEGNIAAGSAVVVGPLLIGLIAASPLGWQAAGFLPMIYGLLLLTGFGQIAFPKPSHDEAVKAKNDQSRPPLPRLFWVFATLLFLSISMEWAIISWTADYLATALGFGKEIAALSVSIFAVAIVIGRVIGRRLLDFMTEGRLIVITLCLMFVSFLIFWQAPLPVFNLIGLFFMGIGVSNLFPLGQGSAMMAAGNQTNRASAAVSLLGGLANLMLPLMIGRLADSFGIQQAFGVMLILIVFAISVIVYANSLQRKARA